MRIENSKLRFFLPGIGIKRYILMIIIGVLLVIYSVFLFLVTITQNENFLSNSLYIGKYLDTPLKNLIVEIIALLLILTSFILIFFGISLLIKSITRALIPDKSDDEIMAMLFERKKDSLKKKIVNIGGGTGTTSVLEGLRGKFLKIAAVITVADSGGSSGRLRAELSIPPPGDIRNCLIALTEENSLARKILSYRFKAQSSCFDGHNLGNILIAGLTKITGDFSDAVIKLAKLLNVEGVVMPFTKEEAVLCAEFEDGTVVEGESEITESFKKIKRVFLKDPQIKPYLPALEYIKDADVIVLGPGSLFTSIIPPLLIPSIADTIRYSKATVVFIVNAMTEHGETDDFKASDHVKEIVKILGENVIDYAIVNTKQFSASSLEKYENSSSFPVEADLENIKKLNIKVITGDFATERGGLIRHDPVSIGEIIMKIAYKKV
ncbi:MAG: uridine diphosphate-N-acetylglucosamine-binding protein YvcK [Caldisericaceae bacterium]